MLYQLRPGEVFADSLPRIWSRQAITVKSWEPKDIRHGTSARAAMLHGGTVFATALNDFTKLSAPV